MSKKKNRVAEVVAAMPDHDETREQNLDDTKPSITKLAKNKNKVWAVITIPDGKTDIISADLYTEMRKQIESIPGCTIVKVFRGREIAVQAKTTLSFLR